ncbi:MAG: cardiolipin synthase [Lachnospiraceae bacterium]|nr:cardiolipin synthase [Lachnospiraceae bacterium]
MLDNVINVISVIWEWIWNNSISINIILAIVIVFFERRDPKNIWTWLLVLYFIPVVGFFLYIVIGQDYHKKKMFRTKEIEDELNGAIKKQEDIIFKNEFKLEDERLKEYSDLVLYNLESAGSVFSENNAVDIFNDGNAKFDDLINEINNAKNFIHIQYYIIRTDELFNRMLEPLKEKAKKGVEVRVLYDGMGGSSLKKSTIREMKKAGIKVAVFFPAYLGRFQFRFNYRNHRKIAVIDGKCAYVGGFNIGREYLGVDKKYGYWRDTHLKIKGDAVNDLQLRFMLDWNYASKENLFKNPKYFGYKYHRPQGKIGMQIISSGPDSKYQTIRDNYLRLINKAKKTIYIHSPYFIPDEAVFNSLKIAALSGVEIKIIIPCKPDHPFVYWVTHSYAGDLLGSGVKVYTYQNGFLHAKGMMVDGIVCSYGTANMDMRSFALNFEVNAVIYNADITSKLETQFLEDLSSCKELTKYNYERRGLFVRFKEQISRLFAPLM